MMTGRSNPRFYCHYGKDGTRIVRSVSGDEDQNTFLGRCSEEMQMHLLNTRPNGGKHRVDDHAHFTNFYFALGKEGQCLGQKGQISLGQLSRGDIEPLRQVLAEALLNIPA
jgi:hypothetical protein